MFNDKINNKINQEDLEIFNIEADKIKKSASKQYESKKVIGKKLDDLEATKYSKKKSKSKNKKEKSVSRSKKRYSKTVEKFHRPNKNFLRVREMNR